MEENVENWTDVFGAPKAWVGVSFETPAWVGTLTRSESPGSVGLGAEVLVLETEEMPLGMARAWALSGGWPAFGTRIRALANALGGEAQLQTFKSVVTREERHELRYIGPVVEDI